MPIKGYKSPDYLDFVGDHRCVITGYDKPDIHHESIVRKYSGGLKKYFDFGAIPLRHDLHLDERHAWGRVPFWEHYDIDPIEVVINLIEEYVSMGPVDIELAEDALEMIRLEHRR